MNEKSRLTSPEFFNCRVFLNQMTNHLSLLIHGSNFSGGTLLGLSGTVGSALNSATQQATPAAKEDNGRLAALRGTQAALTGFQAMQAERLANVSDIGGNTTVTPIPNGPNKDDLAYLSGDDKYVPSPKHAAGGWGTPMDLSDSKAQEVLNNSI